MDQSAVPKISQHSPADSSRLGETWSLSLSKCRRFTIRKGPIDIPSPTLRPFDKLRDRKLRERLRADALVPEPFEGMQAGRLDSRIHAIYFRERTLRWAIFQLHPGKMKTWRG